jgi:hypothetical protein
VASRWEEARTSLITFRIRSACAGSAIALPGLLAESGLEAGGDAGPPGLPAVQAVRRKATPIRAMSRRGARGLARGADGQPGHPGLLPTGDEDHFFAPAGETQRRTRPIIILTASSGLIPSLRTSCFQVWKSSARAITARRC